MYQVLLVDDEMPALRFLQAIIEKYATDFVIAQSCQSGEAALAYLNTNQIDLLLTDISMPGMDGIALCMQARGLQPNIHIAIISGYADFEYAKGAIQASVDDYILKPIAVTNMKEALRKIKDKLDEEIIAKEPALLCALFSNQPYDQALAYRLYGDTKQFFALVRWGNLGFAQGDLHLTSFIPLKNVPFAALYGRDEDEQLLMMKADRSPSEFQAAVKVYVVERKIAPTWTIIFARNMDTFSALPDFFRRASQLMERIVAIGRHQFVFLSNASASTDTIRHISSATLKKLEYFIQESNFKMIKNTFITLATDWEKRQLPQLYATTMVQQLTHLALSTKPTLGARQDTIMQEAKDLLRYAMSYGDLMAGLYSVLFDNNALQDKKLSTEGLYSYAVRYIREKYVQPISIQNVCAEIGISQTYLSRLFRKYGNTSFNVFLTQCRIDNAMGLIREHPGISLRDVATCVGYDDSAYFSKVFHQTIGCTPSQWAAKLNKGTSV